MSADQYPRLRFAQPEQRAGMDPRLLTRLDMLAKRTGKVFTITSGVRSTADQQQLYDSRGSNPNPVARPGSSLHEGGFAADVTVDGRQINDVFGPEQLRAVGLNPQPGDPPHVQLFPVGTSLAAARQQSPSVVKGGDGGSILDPFGVAGAAKDFIAGGGVPGMVIKAGGDKVGDVAQAAGRATAGAIVDLAASAIGARGARILLYIALIGMGVGLAVTGLVRASGLRPVQLAGRAVKAGAVAAVTRNPKAAAAAGAAAKP